MPNSLLENAYLAWLERQRLSEDEQELMGIMSEHIRQNLVPLSQFAKSEELEEDLLEELEETLNFLRSEELNEL
jgi:hypothetical protein